MKPEEIVEFSEGLARVAAAGGGPKALASFLAQATNGAVLLEDAQWRQLASAGTGAIPSSGRAVVESGAPGRARRVTVGDVDLGCLSLFGDVAPDAELLLRLTAATIGIELARDEGALRKRNGDFWNALFAHDFHDASAARDEAAARGIVLAPHYIAVALEVDGGETASSNGLRELRALATDVFRSNDAHVGVLERGGTLFIFAPAARTIDASNAKTAAALLPKSAARRKAQLRFSGGVGTVEPFSRFEASATAAQAALAIGRRIHGDGRVIAYDDLGAYRLLYEGADASRLQVFASETLAPLRNYDENHQTELERTLKLYFKTGQNVKTAAAQLNVHRHTVFYRLRQIGEICARSLDSPHDQLTLRLAVAIDELNDTN
ncbi:MAG: helix-turn-helix domain-containing protein [Candidatus Eremiobacteraeota bacterium]|nr:helix-turn-helix domain-containing protein [Candidatus Eremiobacteraeota bacterium]